MNAEESVPEVGTWARDLTRDKIGCVIGHVGSHVQLRPLGGGQGWDAAPADLEPVPASELLRPRVAEANARSRKGSR
jgi:hypothetical protein